MITVRVWYAKIVTSLLPQPSVLAFRANYKTVIGNKSYQLDSDKYNQYVISYYENLNLMNKIQSNSVWSKSNCCKNSFPFLLNEIY